MMIDQVRDQHGAIVGACRRFGVARLEIFGSSTTGEFDPHRSDLDFLLELRPHATLSRFEQYFGLREALQALFGCPIDLVMVDALRNPYFIDSVNETRQLLYAA